MDYAIKKKLYRVEFVGESKSGEQVTDSIIATTSRSIELQIRHWHPDVGKIDSFRVTATMCSMPLNEFYDGSTRTVINQAYER